MTTEEKATIIPILNSINSIRALNKKALALDLYYLPKFKSTLQLLQHEIKLFAGEQESLPSKQLPQTTGLIALGKLRDNYGIKVVTDLTDILRNPILDSAYIIVPLRGLDAYCIISLGHTYAD